MKHLIKKNKFTIAGAGGGGGKSPPPPPPPTVTQYPSVLAPPQMGNVSSISSFSYAELIDLISDGPIEGLVNKNGKKIYEENIFEGIYLNDSPIKETSSTKTQKISIDFLKRALKDFWSDNKNCFSDGVVNLSDTSILNVDGSVDSFSRILKIGSASIDIDNANFDSGIKITSYNPKNSAYNFIKLLGGSFDVQALLDKTFNLSPIENENIFLTSIEIPKFTIFINKTFDPTEGGSDGKYPLKISIPNLGNYIYFSIGSDSLTSFNYFEMPRSYAENGNLTPAGQKTFLKTLINSTNYYQYEVFNLRLFIWSICSKTDGIKNIDNILDKYFNNLIIYQNDPSLYNYNLVQAEFKNGAEIQTPLKAFNRIEIENNIGKELVGPFKLTSSKILKASTPTRDVYEGVVRLTNLNADSNSKPSYNNVITESSDDIRYVKAWPVEYTTLGACPYLICNLYMNYSVYDKTSSARTFQSAVPVTHYVANENVEEVYVTLSLEGLYDTAHVDLVTQSAAFASNKHAQTDPVIDGTKTWAQIQKLDYAVNSLKDGYFLIAGASINDGYIIDQSDNLNDIFCNIKNTISITCNYYSAIKSSIGLSTKINNIDAYIMPGTLGTASAKYDLTTASPLRCWTVPNDTCYTKESICINGYIGNPDAFEAKLKSKNIDGTISYHYGLSDRESLVRNGTDFLTAFAVPANGPGNVFVAKYQYYSAPASELKSRATVALILNSYIDYAAIFKFWNSSTNSVPKNNLDTINNLNILYPNVQRYIVDPFLRYWSSKSNLTYTIKDGAEDVIKNLYLIGFNKHYIDSQTAYFESNGKLKLSILDQFLEDYVLKAPSGLTYSPSIETASKITDVAFTSGLQNALIKYEGGKLIGFSSVFLFELVKDLSKIDFYDPIEIKNNPNRVNIFFEIGETSSPNRSFLNPKNIFIINEGYTKVNENFDVVIFYQLYSNISSTINNPNLPTPSYAVGDGKGGATAIDGTNFRNSCQNITAGTRLPAVVRVQVETGYESKERIDYIGPNEYFKYFFDIFGMSTQQSYIDLGRKAYDFVYGERGSFDSGGYISKTTNIYYPNKKLFLLKVTSSTDGITENTKFFLTDNKEIDFVDLSLNYSVQDTNKGIYEIIENDKVIGLKQEIDTTNSIYLTEAITKYNELIFGPTSKLNDFKIGDLDEGGTLKHKICINNLNNSGIKDLTFGNGCYVVVSSGGLLATSSDGENWITRNSDFGVTGIQKVIYGNSLYVAAGNSGRLSTSSDTINWTRQTSSFLTTGISGLAYGNNCYVIAGASGKLATSSDALNWTSRNINWGATGISTVAFGNNCFVIAGQSGKLATSSDAQTWTEQNSKFGTTGINCVIYGNSLFVAAGMSGKLAVSKNAQTWTEQNSSFGTTGICTLAYYNGNYYAGGISGTFACSLDGCSWKQDSNFRAEYGAAINNDVCTILGCNNKLIAGGNLTGRFIISCGTSTDNIFNNGYEEIDLGRADSFLRKLILGKQILPNNVLSVESYANSYAEFISSENNFDTYMVYDSSNANKFIKIELYNYDYTAFEIVQVPTQDQINSYVPTNYYISFYFEEFVGYRGNIYQSLYRTLETKFSDDVIIQFSALETNPTASNVLGVNVKWNKGNFIIRISKTNFDPIAGINEFTVSDKIFGSYKNNLDSSFKINLSNHINTYLSEELILDKINSKQISGKNFLTRTDGTMDSLDFEFIKNYFKNKNWIYEHKRSDIIYENIARFFLRYAAASQTGAVKHIVASESISVPSINIRNRGSIINPKVEPLSISANIWTIYYPDQKKFGLIFHNPSKANNYKELENFIQSFDLMKFTQNNPTYVQYGPRNPSTISTPFTICVTDFNFYTRLAYEGSSQYGPYGPSDRSPVDSKYIGTYLNQKYVTYSKQAGGRGLIMDWVSYLSNDGGCYRVWEMIRAGFQWASRALPGFISCVPNHETRSRPYQYFSPTFQSDVFQNNLRFVMIDIPSTINSINQDNILNFAEYLLLVKNILPRDMKIKNYKLSPSIEKALETSGSKILLNYYRNLPLSNIDSDSQNTFANDAGLSIKLPSPKYYSDGTPFRRYVKVTKLSYETLSPLISKKIALSKITEIIPQKFSYPFSSMVAMKIDSRAFSQIPTRTYDCKLKKILVPSNYFPNDEDGEDVRYMDGTGKYKIYEGDWDGTFKLMWTNNPAWILMDMLVNKRYGLGTYISSDQIDIWELYKIARWCDGVDDNGYYYGVPDSYGGTEPRHAFNGIITDKFNVFDMINQIASIFRGHVYYMNSMITFDDDRLKPIIGEFNNSDVKDGIFNYTNHKKDDEFTAVEVAYIDEKDNYKPKIEYVEDSDGIRKRGILKKQINAFGVTSKGQARRLGLHFLFQTSKENMNISFITDMKALLYKPGDLVGINDELLNSYRNFGKVEKIENISDDKFKITVSPTICDTFLDTSEITLYTAISKPKYEDILCSVESYPYQLKIQTIKAITQKSDGLYVNKEYEFNTTQDKDLINQAYCYTGSIIFDYSNEPKVTKNLQSSLRYIKNYDINNNYSIKYGHWRLTTGDVNNICQDLYLFDSTSDLICKNTNQKKQYFFSLFDSGKYLRFTGMNLLGEPSYEYSGFSLTGNTDEPFKISVNNSLGYSSGLISYSQIIENDRPSIENFKIITGYHYPNDGYSELEISKSGWNYLEGGFEKIKESVLDGIQNLVTGSPFSLKIKNINQPIFKIMSITENYINEYSILATEYNTQKFKLIEENSSIDDLNNTFNFLSAYNSKNNNSKRDFLLKAPIFKSLKYVVDNKYGKKYLNIQWSPSNEYSDLIYQIFIQTPSKQTNNHTISNIGSDYYSEINNEYEVNFDLENANFEVGTYQVSIFSSSKQLEMTEELFLITEENYLSSANNLNRISNMTSRSILILEY
jgi:hypothetical protein